MEDLERTVADLVRQTERSFFGKYRGLVVDNDDPEQLGRLRAQVPSILGEETVTGWALPCSPYGGMENQGWFVVPDIGAGVWVEFEQGDLEFPVWSGTFWSKPGGTTEVPIANGPDGAETDVAPVTRRVMKTTKGHTIQLEDADDDELVLIHEATNGNTVKLDADGITVTDGANSNEVVMSTDGVAVTDANGNSIEMTSSGITIADSNGNEIAMASGGISVGSGATEAFVHGTTFALNVTNFLTSLSTHTHVGNMGAPTSPPTAPMNLDVPTSSKHKVE